MAAAAGSDGPLLIRASIFHKDGRCWFARWLFPMLLINAVALTGLVASIVHSLQTSPSSPLQPPPSSPPSPPEYIYIDLGG